jgi:DNA-binding XRE family transcriptional regulator
MPSSPRLRGTGRCSLDSDSKIAIIASVRYGDSTPALPLERLRARLAGAEAGWFFAAIAGQVAERRAARGLSQRELADLVGTTQSAIARLESGGRPPRIDTLLRIADALECDLHVELTPRAETTEENA